jgi:hypothetical protein
MPFPAKSTPPIGHFIAEVTLVTGEKVKAIVRGKNIFHAGKLLNSVYGSQNVGLVREYALFKSPPSWRFLCALG